MVRSEESAAVGLRNLVTQWHLSQRGKLQSISRFFQPIAAELVPLSDKT